MLGPSPTRAANGDDHDRFFWLAAVFSNLGMWALTFGRLWLMYELTQSPVMVGQPVLV
jgi:hypothetical protein